MKKYLLLAFVLFLSFLGAIILPVTEIFKGVIALPGVSALFYALFTLMRDEWIHSRNIFLQNKQQDFILSTSSHAAEVAYDKHVIFCEEYIKRIEDGRQELFRDGPSPKAMNIGSDLVRIRQKHAAWLTDDIESKLRPFEKALIDIGANEHYLQMTAGEGMNEKRKAIVEEIYRSFDLVLLGNEKSTDEASANLHIDKVIDKIRDVLGIKAITKLRIGAIEVALKRLEEI